VVVADPPTKPNYKSAEAIGATMRALVILTRTEGLDILPFIRRAAEALKTLTSFRSKWLRPSYPKGRRVRLPNDEATAFRKLAKIFGVGDPEIIPLVLFAADVNEARVTPEQLVVEMRQHIPAGRRPRAKSPTIPKASQIAKEVQP
jgi:hypothetical protein